ncbi:MAG: Crp/Fnr family transcriptional regulator [Flavobacteriaceae bacterium]|nr:Crp/Fnr family transcriptional regulator [Flavobacteriaceae bacterium]
MNTESFLNYIDEHITLSEDEKTFLLTKLNFRKYQKGQYVVQQGDVCRYENFVVSGCLKTFFVDNEGDEHVIMFSVENWWSADLSSFFTQTPADYNVLCLENTEVIQIGFEEIEELYINIPKLERFFRILFQNSIVAFEKRLVRNLSMTAKDRYLYFKKRYPQIEQRVPQYAIASYIGVTKEFLSKIKSQLILEQ